MRNYWRDELMVRPSAAADQADLEVLTNKQDSTDARVTLAARAVAEYLSCPA
jgi:hypothetical protein